MYANLNQSIFSRVLQSPAETFFEVGIKEKQTSQEIVKHGGFPQFVLLKPQTSIYFMEILQDRQTTQRTEELRIWRKTIHSFQSYLQVNVRCQEHDWYQTQPDLLILYNKQRWPTEHKLFINLTSINAIENIFMVQLRQNNFLPCVYVPPHS